MGDDQAGWRVVQLLGPLAEPETRSLLLSEPTQLIDHLDHCDRLIVIDATSSGQPAGTVHRLTWPDRAIEIGFGRTSHGLGLGSVLALAGRLDRLPPEVILFGIEAERGTPKGDLSAAVADALPGLAERVRQELERKR
jgi:hydrogenase maturation protease